MATKAILIFYSSALPASIVAAFEIMHKNTGETITLKDVNGIANATLATYISNLVDATYDEIWITSLCESTASGTATDTLNLADQYSLRAKLKVASQGTLSAAQDNATTYSATTIGLSTASPVYVVNTYTGQHVVIYGGTGADQLSEVMSNTATVLTIRGTFFAVPGAGSDYKILTGCKLYICGATHTDGAVIKKATEITHAHLYPNNPAPIICSLLGGTPIYNYITGTSSAVAATTLTVAAPTFTAHDLIGKYLQIYTASTNGFQYALITENTTTVITFAAGWNLGLTPTGTPVYAVVDSLNFVFRDLYIKYYILTYLSDLTSGTVKAEYGRMFNSSDNQNIPGTGQAFPQDWDWINGTIFSKGSIILDALRKSVSA